MTASLLRWLFVTAACVLVQGCATVQSPDPRDPFESVNRSVFQFNDAVDRTVLKPVATVYQGAVPSWTRKGVRNFFGNLSDVWSVINNGLQLRGQAFSDSVGRVMINSTLGVGGLLDVASDLDIDKHPANFNLTLGRWGVPAGPYVVLPFLGPHTLREVAALPIDRQGNPVNQLGDENTRTGLTLLNVVDVRARLLDAEKVVNAAALDRYSFTRDAYLQRQRSQVYDGDPPPEPASLEPLE